MTFLMTSLEFVLKMIFGSLLTIAFLVFSEVFPIMLIKCVEKVKEKLNVRDS